MFATNLPTCSNAATVVFRLFCSLCAAVYIRARNKRLLRCYCRRKNSAPFARPRFNVPSLVQQMKTLSLSFFFIFFPFLFPFLPSYFYRSGFKRRQCSRSLSKRYRGWIFPRVTTDDINSSDMCESLYDHLLCLFLRKINDFITQVSIYIFCENVIENIGNGHFDCSNSL